MTDVSATSANPSPTFWRRPVAPIIITVALVVWTIYVSPHSKYGDAWAIWPAILALPVALIWHIALVVMPGRRLSAAFVGAIHMAFLVYIWLWSLTLISKDSL